MTIKQKLIVLARNKYIKDVIRKGILLASPLVNIVGIKDLKGYARKDKRKPNIIIVSHEASPTGAPILALEICKKLSKTSNVITIVLRKGALIENFRDCSCRVVVPRLGILTSTKIKELAKSIGSINYALVNSVVSAGAIQPIKKNNIPVIMLVHEFSAYIRPPSVIDIIGTYANYIVYSSNLTKADIEAKYPQIMNAKSKILPQGQCQKVKSIKKKTEQWYRENIDQAGEYLNEIDKTSILILGAGQIQPRKGVDYFISVADKIIRNNKDLDIKFAWIGSGYDPYNDFNVSLWLEDQINRAGIGDRMVILNESEAYLRLIERCDLFLVTSRLDPLPNVAIDALSSGKPVLCFEKACGIADIYKNEKELHSALVADYLDVENMADLVLKVATDKQIYGRVSSKCKELARKISK